MKKIIFLAIASLLAVTATAQQLKTAQGITTITTIEKPKKPKKTLAPIERGFEQSVEVSVNPGDEIFASAEYIAGYRFNNYLFLGGGTGLEWFLDFNSFAIPIYANTRLYLLPKNRWQPFISLSLGVLVPIIQDGREHYVQGFHPHINPSVGVNYRINSKYSCYLNLGYMPRWTYYDSYYGYRYYDNHCLTIRLGFTF